MKKGLGANALQHRFLKQVSDPSVRSETVRSREGELKDASNLPRFNPGIFPPWQHGANNDAIKRGLEFTVPEVDNLADFHGDPRDPKLSLFLCYGTLVAVSS